MLGMLILGTFLCLAIYVLGVDLTVTAASVQPGTSATTKSTGTAGEAIVAGEVLYLSSADSRLYKADSNDTAAKAAAVGIALNSAPAAGQPLTYVPTGYTVNLGAILTVGELYCVSENAGKICPEGDLASGEYVTLLGIATTTSLLPLTIVASGVQVPA